MEPTTPAPLREAPGRILIIDDDERFCVLAQRILQGAGHDVEVCHDAESGLRRLGEIIPDVLCLDLGLPDMRGIDVLERVRAHHRLVSVIVLTADSTVDSVVTAMKLGAWDYLTKPVDRARLLTIVRNAIAHSHMAVRLLHLEREAHGHGYPGFVGSSPPMKALFRQIDRVASSDITVLVHGESGTGKELAARAIHDHSGRKNAPFVALNCAAVPESLQESELFGHERGAFTGAIARRAGKFELADRGTLFLDEVAELSPSAQAKLLRVLQERRFQRLGGNQEVVSDFRLIAATHRDLLKEARAGRFREDLYFRIAVFELELPPLRERGDDVILLANATLERAQRSGGASLQLSQEAMAVIRSYSWPGNVRELQNAIERAIVIASGPEIKASDLPARLCAHPERPAASLAALASAPISIAEMNPNTPPAVAAGGLPTSSAQPPTQSHADPIAAELDIPAALAGAGSLEEVERRTIEQALKDSRGNITEAVRRLGIGRSTLYRKLKQYKLTS